MDERKVNAMKPIIIAMAIIFIGLSLLIAAMADRAGDEFVLDIKALTNQVKELEKNVQAFEDDHAYVRVSVSAYNPTRQQCDSTPFITASNQRVRKGIVALSRDLEKDFGLKFGDTVHLLGHGTFEFQDRMNKRWKRRVDLFMWNKKEAMKFGRQQGMMVIKG